MKPPLPYNFSMLGKVRRNRENFYIDLHWRGERFRLFSDKDGNPFYSERQANRILERINSEIDSDDFNPKNYIRREIKALRLDNYALAWIERQKLRLDTGEISHGYFRELRSVVHNHLIPNLLGTRDIRSMNKGHLKDFRDSLEVSAKSKKNILGVLRSIFTDALDREDIIRVPEFPQVKVGDPQIHWLEPEAQDEILAQFTDPVRKAFFHLLVHMGMRPGEARALRWDDIDFNRQVMTIHAAMDLNHYRPTTKEKDVRDDLPIPPEVVASLKNLKEQAPRNPGGFIFTFRGKPFSKQRVGKWWRQAATAAGYDIPLYQATKHSLCCQARARGVSLDVIQDWCGHKSAESTRRYAKIMTETLKVMHRQQNVSSLEEKRKKINKKK